jgi:hypothetical protein
VIVKESVVLIPLPDQLATLTGWDAVVVIVVVVVVTAGITEFVVGEIAEFKTVVVHPARIRGRKHRTNNLFIACSPCDLKCLNSNLASKYCQ